MLGAIIGDMAGSVYERPENNIKMKDFPFFDRFLQITDDTGLSCAGCDKNSQVADTRACL